MHSDWKALWVFPRIKGFKPSQTLKEKKIPPHLPDTAASYLVSSATSTSVGAVIGAFECPAVGSSVFSSPFVELITCTGGYTHTLFTCKPKQRLAQLHKRFICQPGQFPFTKIPPDTSTHHCVTPNLLRLWAPIRRHLPGYIVLLLCVAFSTLTGLQCLHQRGIQACCLRPSSSSSHFWLYDYQGSC